MNKLALKIIKNKARIAISVLVLLVFLGHAAGEFKIPLVERLENITYDVRVRMNVSSKKDDSVVIIDIDEKSLKSYDFDDFRNIVDPKFFYSSRKIYTPYQYKHVFGKDFVPNISIMDLLFSEGPNSLEIINNSDSFEIKPI